MSGGKDVFDINMGRNDAHYFAHRVSDVAVDSLDSETVRIDVYFEHDRSSKTTRGFVLVSDLKAFIDQTNWSKLTHKRSFASLGIIKRTSAQLANYIVKSCKWRLEKSPVNKNRLFIDVHEMEPVIRLLGLRKGLNLIPHFLHRLWKREEGFTLLNSQKDNSNNNLPAMIRFKLGNQRNVTRDTKLSDMTWGDMEDLVSKVFNDDARNTAIEEYKLFDGVAKEAVNQLKRRYKSVVHEKHKKNVPILRKKLERELHDDVKRSLEINLRESVKFDLKKELRDEVYEDLVKEHGGIPKVEALRRKSQPSLPKRARKSPMGPLFPQEKDMINEVMDMSDE